MLQIVWERRTSVIVVRCTLLGILFSFCLPLTFEIYRTVYFSCIFYYGMYCNHFSTMNFSSLCIWVVCRFGWLQYTFWNDVWFANKCSFMFLLGSGWEMPEGIITCLKSFVAWATTANMPEHFTCPSPIIMPDTRMGFLPLHPQLRKLWACVYGTLADCSICTGRTSAFSY